MKHVVNFTVKNIDEGDRDFRLIQERTEKFKTFNQAMSFTRELKSRLNRREALVGYPIIEEAA